MKRTFPESPGPQPPEGTRAALIAAGLALFGAKGFAATSTREVAARAGTNVASIAYHFGGKDGLRHACGEEVARRIGAVIGAPTLPGALSPDAAEARLEKMLRAMVSFVTQSAEAGGLVAFVMRELNEDGPVLDRLYAAFLEPKHRELCALWEFATGAPAESARTRLSVFAILGQVIYFRIGAPVIRRRLGWSEITGHEAGQIADVLAGNLHALILRERNE